MDAVESRVAEEMIKLSLATTAEKQSLALPFLSLKVIVHQLVEFFLLLFIFYRQLSQLSKWIVGVGKPHPLIDSRNNYVARHRDFVIASDHADSVIVIVLSARDGDVHSG